MHPSEISKALSSGQFTDFGAACQALITALNHERNTDDESAKEGWNKVIAEATRALAIYEEEVSTAKATALSRMNAEGLGFYADAINHPTNLAY